MDIKTYKKVAPVLFRNKIVPFLWGAQGVGKTEVHRQIASEMGVQFVSINLGAVADVGDVIGLLVKQANGTVTHAAPDWFPTEGSGIIFLDELNRMHPDIMQAMFNFITSGRLHTHQLPPGWSIAAAGNYQSGDFQVTDTSDAAWMSRFCHLDFKPTVEEFNLYAEKRGALLLADFMREQPNMLEKGSDKKFDFSTITPDRRAWLNFVQPLELEQLDDVDRYELYMGLVGPAAASAYLSFKVKAEKGLNLRDILANYDGQRHKVTKASQGSKTRFDFLNKPVAELLTKLADNKEFLADPVHMTNLKAFLVDIPLELSQRVFKDIAKLDFVGKNDLLNDMTFCKQIAGKTK